MPLLSVSAQGNNAEHLCIGCGNERPIPKGQWIPQGEGHFTSPPCPTCNAQETFLWHDWVYESHRTVTKPVTDEDGNERKVFDPRQRKEVTVVTTETESFLDETHPAAEQQTLIALVAQALGTKKQKRGNGAHSYAREPKVPTKERVRESFKRR